MGQYWKTVNIDKREYICPHKLGGGLKLWEQVNNPPGTPVALFILTAAMPVPRGGGDLQPHPAIGRWAGDRVFTIGDYAEDSDVPRSKIPASVLYSLCHSSDELDDQRSHLRKMMNTQKCPGQRDHYRKLLRQLRGKEPFNDISDMVAEVIERECMGKFSGDGWRQWIPNTPRLQEV